MKISQKPYNLLINVVHNQSISKNLLDMHNFIDILEHLISVSDIKFAEFESTRQK